MDTSYSLPGLRPPPNVRYMATMGVFAVSLLCVLYYLYKINNPGTGPIEFTFSAKFIAVDSSHRDWRSPELENALRPTKVGGRVATDADDWSGALNLPPSAGGFNDFQEQYYQRKSNANELDEMPNPSNRLSVKDGLKSSNDGRRKYLRPLSADFINAINVRFMPQWKAGRNFPEGSSWKSIVALAATLLDVDKTPSNDQIFDLTWENLHKLRPPRRSRWLPPSFTGSEEGGPTSEEERTARLRAAAAKELPKKFDAREAWPQCPSIGQLRDQGGCGSDWAEAPAAAISDRLCIHEQEYFRVSGYDLMTCCFSCGLGCSGGSVESAFLYYMNVGLVSGGPYESGIGCKPDGIGPYNFQVDDTGAGTPNCSHTCIGSVLVEGTTDYYWDRQTGYQTYRIADTLLIQRDLFNNGPMVAIMDVYEDFFQYRAGVYQHAEGRYVGHHAVRVLGYGVEEEVPYYLCANSWGPEWGNKGFFKINLYLLYNFIVGY